MRMNDKGFTLVEVMAGFSLLVVLMVSFVKIINISSNLTIAAVDAKNKTNDFYKSYYSGENYYTVNNKEKPAFRLSKGTENTVELLDDDGAVIPFSIVEVFNADSEEKESDPIPLSKDIKLKRIENVYDYNISRINVFRYVRVDKAS